MKSKLFALHFLICFCAFSQNHKSLDNHQYKVGAKINDTLSIAYTPKGDKYGVVTADGKFVIPLTYQRLEYENGLLIATVGKKQGILSPYGKIITPVKYDWVGARIHNRFLVRLNNKYGLLDDANNFVLPFGYSGTDLLYISKDSEDYHYIFKNKQGLSGIYDYTGKQIIPEKYVFYNVDGDKIFCTDSGKPMILHYNDMSKNIILPQDISLVKTFPHYCWGERHNQIFLKDGKYGLISSENEILIPPLYDELKNIFCGHNFLVKQKGKYGIVSYNNKLREEIRFEAYQQRKEIVVLKKNGEKDRYFSADQID